MTWRRPKAGALVAFLTAWTVLVLGGWFVTAVLMRECAHAEQELTSVAIALGSLIAGVLALSRGRPLAPVIVLVCCAAIAGYVATKWWCELPDTATAAHLRRLGAPRAPVPGEPESTGRRSPASGW